MFLKEIFLFVIVNLTYIVWILVYIKSCKIRCNWFYKLMAKFVLLESQSTGKNIRRPPFHRYCHPSKWMSV